jgi:hypothetical protein
MRLRSALKRFAEKDVSLPIMNRCYANVVFPLLAAVALLLGACSDKTEFSEVPFIRYTAFEQLKTISGKDSIGMLKLYFTDGDGDMGLNASDTLSPYNKGSLYYYNFFITYFEKQNGVWTKVVLPPPFPGADTLTNNSRIPNLTPTGQNKSLEGEISMQLFTNNPFSPYDTIRYEVRICDRALNMSNLVQTPEIVLVK